MVFLGFAIDCLTRESLIRGIDMKKIQKSPIRRADKKKIQLYKDFEGDEVGSSYSFTVMEEFGFEGKLEF